MVSERKVGKDRGEFGGEEGEESAFAGAGGAFLRLGGEGLEKWGKRGERECYLPMTEMSIGLGGWVTRCWGGCW